MILNKYNFYLSIFFITYACAPNQSTNLVTNISQSHTDIEKLMENSKKQKKEIASLLDRNKSLTSSNYELRQEISRLKKALENKNEEYVKLQTNLADQNELQKSYAMSIALVKFLNEKKDGNLSDNQKNFIKEELRKNLEIIKSDVNQNESNHNKKN